MTRDEHRNACIEAIAHAIEDGRPFPDFIAAATAAFDALHGIARVEPMEPTEQILNAAAWQRHRDHLAWEWCAMAAAGDLTNSPEKT